MTKDKDIVGTTEGTVLTTSPVDGPRPDPVDSKPARTREDRGVRMSAQECAEYDAGIRQVLAWADGFAACAALVDNPPRLPDLDGLRSLSERLSKGRA